MWVHLVPTGLMKSMKENSRTVNTSQTITYIYIYQCRYTAYKQHLPGSHHFIPKKPNTHTALTHLNNYILSSKMYSMFCFYIGNPIYIFSCKFLCHHFHCVPLINLPFHSTEKWCWKTSIIQVLSIYSHSCVSEHKTHFTHKLVPLTWTLIDFSQLLQFYNFLSHQNG